MATYSSNSSNLPPVLAQALDKDPVSTFTSKNVLDSQEELHIPVAKFHSGDPQPTLDDIRAGFSSLYIQDKNSGIHAEKFWTVPLSNMVHCGIKKYGDVNNLDKKRLNLHERIIHSVIVIPPGSSVNQYPLGGIFTFNPFFEVVCGYVFTAWKDVSELAQAGISHVAVFRKVPQNPAIRKIRNASYLNKENCCELINLQTENGLRKMRLFVSQNGRGTKLEHGIVLQDLDMSNTFSLDLVKVRIPPEDEEPAAESWFPSLSQIWDWAPGLEYLDEAWT